MIKNLLLLMVFVYMSVVDAELNRGNAALVAVHRAVRSPQQNNFPSFPNMPPPGFDASHIVSQNTDVNKNGFAQTTIYKSENGMGSSSTSYSQSGASLVKLLPTCTTIAFIILAINFIRN
ncbi:uncharacterized protein LOC134215588 [Armigeres subalbatus]|uniref:uncharacterized protein LOC134215588 n=1 Tax=Armigeres subalbatus TaxID=124917 RepID=UPI002ED37B3B